MDNSGVGTGQAATLALLADTARAGRGGGYWGGGEGGYGGPFASPSSNAVRLNRNGQQIENQADATRDILGLGLSNIASSFENQMRAGEFTRVCDKISEMSRQLSDNQFRAELRNSDQLSAVREKQAQDAAASALCCCKAEAQAAVNQGVTDAKLAAIEAKIDSNKEIFELQARLQTQEILVKTNNGCGVGTVPCAPCPQ